MSEPTLWIINASEVVPITDGFPVIADGAVVCSGDRILWVGPEKDIPDELSPPLDGDVLDARRGVVLPGLIDCHTHLVFAGSRAGEFAQRLTGATYEEILASGGGILGTVRATRKATKAQLAQLGRHRLRKLLAGGVTTVEAKSGYGLDLETELKILSVTCDLHRQGPWDVVPTFLGAHTVPAEWREDRAEYLRIVLEEMLPAVVKQNLARFCDVFCEPGLAFDVDETRQVLERARRAGLGLKVHADQLTAGGGGRLAGEMGAASADHLEFVDEAGIAAMARAGTVAVLLPGAAYFLGSPAPPVSALRRARVPMALSTDFNPGSSPTSNLLLMASMACVQWKLTVPEALTAVTANAAQALQIGRDRGRIVPGMRADLAVFGVHDHRDLVYWFGNCISCAVVKDGHLVGL